MLEGTETNINHNQNKFEVNDNKYNNKKKTSYLH